MTQRNISHGELYSVNAYQQCTAEYSQHFCVYRNITNTLFDETTYPKSIQKERHFFLPGDKTAGVILPCKKWAQAAINKILAFRQSQSPLQNHTDGISSGKSTRFDLRRMIE